MNSLDRTLERLGFLVHTGSFEQLETEALEIKPVPPSGKEWRQFYISVNAFLNTKGGVVVLGVKEEGRDANRRYVLTGWRDDEEKKLQKCRSIFTDHEGHELDLTSRFPDFQVREFEGGRVAVVLVDCLPADEKYAFYEGAAYERVLTGDNKIDERRIAEQKHYAEESKNAHERRIVPSATIDDVDLGKLNEFIFRLNQPTRIESIKQNLESAEGFLRRRHFLIDGNLSTLGVLVCGTYPEHHLHFRCHVHGYVDVPDKIAQDKQTIVDNILPLMEKSLAYVFRNIHVGVSHEHGGTAAPQYPEQLLREIINNSLAHRDYTLDRQNIITIKPSIHIAVRNPGKFPPHLIINGEGDDGKEVLRIIPDAKPRNPKLADILHLFEKWEGRGIGMATLVNDCLADRIDLPTYQLRSEEVELVVPTGKLLDDRMQQLFDDFSRYLAERLGTAEISQSQKSVLAYFVKTAWANRRGRYTVLLTKENNHFEEIASLAEAGLLRKATKIITSRDVYVPDPALLKVDFNRELSRWFGRKWDDPREKLSELGRRVLTVLYRRQHFSKKPFANAKSTTFTLWQEDLRPQADIKEFDAFYRKIRLTFNSLQKGGFVERMPTKKIQYQLAVARDTERTYYDDLE